MEQAFYQTPPVYDNIRKKIRQYLPHQNGKDFSVFPIGKSVLGKGIFAVRLGNPRQYNLFVGGVHGQEWLGTLLLFRFLDDLIFSAGYGVPLCDTDVKKALEHHGLVIVPALNPDGIDIGLLGAEGGGFLKEQLRELSGGDFSRWQANARGVDLNHNFDAGFALCKQAEIKAGSPDPGPENLADPFPKANPKAAPSAGLSHPVRCGSCMRFMRRGKKFITAMGKTPRKNPS